MEKTILSRDKRIEILSKITNRSKSQTKYLFELCDNSFDKLIELEQKIMDNFVEHCPTRKVDIVRILNKPGVVDPKICVRKKFDFQCEDNTLLIMTGNVDNGVYTTSDDAEKWEHYAG